MLNLPGWGRAKIQQACSYREAVPSGRCGRYLGAALWLLIFCLCLRLVDGVRKCFRILWAIGPEPTPCAIAETRLVVQGQRCELLSLGADNPQGIFIEVSTYHYSSEYSSCVHKLDHKYSRVFWVLRLVILYFHLSNTAPSSTRAAEKNSS